MSRQISAADVVPFVGSALPGLGVNPAIRTIHQHGDSRTYECWETSAAATALNWLGYAQAIVPGGPRFKVTGNTGIIGNTTAQMLARFATDVLAKSPTAITLWGGTNDAWTTTAMVDASIANIVAMVQQANAAGIFVFLLSEAPTNNGASFNNLVLYFNSKLRAWAELQRGVRFVDIYAALVDPLSATGGVKTGMYRPGEIHLTPAGAYAMGQALAPALAAYPPFGGGLVSSVSDTQDVSTAQRQTLPNPLMQGTGGTLGSGHTGTITNGHTSSGTAGATLSLQARADGFGNNQRSVITAADATQTYSETISIGNLSRFVPGHTYVLEGSLALSAVTNLARAALRLIIYYTDSTSDTIGMLSPLADIGAYPATGEMILRSPELTIPSSKTLAGANLTLNATFSGAGGATIDLGRLSVRDVTP